MAGEHYPIGTPGTPWGEAEKSAWRRAQSVRRSYQEEVLRRLQPLAEAFDLRCYGALEYDEGRYPLYGLLSRDWQQERPARLGEPPMC